MENESIGCDGSDLMSPDHARASLAQQVGIALLALPLVGSCLAAPFLFPLLQAILLAWMVPPALFGLVGGWRRSWGITLGLTAVALTAYVLHDLLTDEFGLVVIYDTCVLGLRPAGLEYYHEWAILLDVTILVLWPGVAITVHASIDRWRVCRWQDRTRAARCASCDYSLRGFSEPRCSECGEAFDPDHAAAAIQALEEDALRPR
ncbi:MAG: hypothetical protein SF069_13685 [Phycisphaerae bacterium]|nr:hypothetical protein [Phycisphaerae bacterium]